MLVEKDGRLKQTKAGTLIKTAVHSATVDVTTNEEAESITVSIKDGDGNVATTKTVTAPLTKVHTEINGIKAVIPSTASADNKLADKNFVNSSIGTNTAKYISNNGEPFTSLEQLQAYSGTVTQNDYAFVTGTDSGNTYYDRYKADVSGDTVTWGKEYRLNNSSFTADQWGAINSGVTSGKLEEIDEAIASIGSTVPEPTAKDKLLISNEELEWVEVDKDQVGEVTTRCTKAEWEAKTEAERIALSGSAVDILDDYSEADNNVYSTEETVVGKWIDGKKIYRKVFAVSVSITAGNYVNVTSILVSDYNFSKIINAKVWGSDIMGSDIRARCNDGTYLKINSSQNFNNIQYLELEYTKTTD